MELYDAVRVASRRLGVKVRLVGEAAVSNDADRAFVAASVSIRSQARTFSTKYRPARQP